MKRVPSQAGPAAGGFSLVELLVGLLLLGLMTSVAGLAASSLLRRQAVVTSAERLAAELRLRRVEARSQGRRLGLHFDNAGDHWRVSLLADGDGDGLHSADRRRGVDVTLEGPQSFASRYGHAGPGFLEGLEDFVSPPPVGRRVDITGNPVKLGRSRILSLGPDGRGNSGTVYLTDGRWRQLALVIQGTGGRIRLWEWDRGRNSWRPRW